MIVDPITSKIPVQAWMEKPSTQTVMNALQSDGRDARFVGGCVRDSLIGRSEISNIDIATPIEPDGVIALLEQAGLRAIPTGLEHGTITTVFEGEIFEITTLRRDIDTDGRHAKIAFSDNWLTDAQRRDFTINAIYCDVKGALYDPFGGSKDLKSGKVRFVGNAEKRISEDFLRILRFFRFYAHFGSNTPDAEAISACTKSAGKLKTLSGDRIRSELIKWLAAHSPIESLKHGTSCGVIANILNFSPDTSTFSKLETLVSAEHSLRIPDPVRRLALLMSHIKPSKNTSQHLNFPRKTKRRLEAMLASTADISPTLDDTAVHREIYRLGVEYVVDVALMNWAQSAAQDDVTWKTFIDSVTHWRAPQFPISGQDIVDLGIPPGHQVGQVLNEVEEWWIAGNFQSTRAKILSEARAVVTKYKGATDQ